MKVTQDGKEILTIEQKTGKQKSNEKADGYVDILSDVNAISANSFLCKRKSLLEQK